ncbi:hypothetical protein [Candidatus Phytoplasma citri]|uniref:Uncharacterized protein n=1 Tax=Candidatus Phytoplasma citri TaxID=180978 RepID=A0A1S9M3V9_9MOLU|nr:hypothetical protein [Candidatus Phytoplasma aurantifolia]MDO8059988.1 hypothetical protein [Candidatus Phytoplasma aurantifolia]MDO8078766.1 hypothetical protein [Candidatus Phytoplasma aurantifolia]OOP59789.1 hypothetical protein B2G44_00595 [Candidatus Phytoplasma aurantifolia]
MRIIPYELYPYAPDISLCALRKEFGMYDYCLNKNIKNKAMQPFLDLGRNYFNLSINKWVLEMHQRIHYVNSFHDFYAKNHNYTIVNTNFLVILECCLQWELKRFMPHNKNISWYIIIKSFLSVDNQNNLYDLLSLDMYQYLKNWYCDNFMFSNKQGNLKPKNLDMKKVILFFKKNLF